MADGLDGITPTSATTKLGNILVILLIALVAIWLANNLGFLSRLTGKRTA